MNTYALVYLCSWLLTLLITPVVIRLGRRFDVVDSPDVRKVHSRPIPHIGGVVVFLPMMALTVSVLFLDDTFGEDFRNTQARVITLLGAATFMFLVGLIDDIKGLRAKVKLFCQVAAAITVCASGIRITSITISGWFSLNLGWFSWPLTIFWIVGVTNAVNLIDGLDGLATGIGAIACGVIAVLSIYFHQPVMTVIMLSLLGALVGFLFFNFNPAKIFMGDCGSLFLGFALASASVMCATNSQAIVGLTLPILALGIPIFDTLFSMLRRFLERRSMFASDSSHFHHRLLALGLCQRHVVITAYVLAVLVAGLGMFMLFTSDVQTVIIFICILTLLGLVFSVVGSVRLRETIEGLKKKYTINSRMTQERESFEKVQLHFCRSRTFDQWWRSVCLAVEDMRFTAVSMSVTNRDGTKRILSWGEKSEYAGLDEMVKMTIPVRDRRDGPPLGLEVKVNTNGSLESVGRRVALFSRLIEEHGITNLPSKTENTSALKLTTAR